MKKIGFVTVLLLLAVCTLCAFSVNLRWDASPPNPEFPSITYSLYAGQASRSYNYTNNVGDKTNESYTGPDITTYFAVTASGFSTNDGSFQESDYSDELVWVVGGTTNTPPDTNAPPITNTPPIINGVYIGALLDYGTDLGSLSHKLVWLDTLSANNLFRLSLVITNKPPIGQVPNDGNNYRYLVSKLDYGTNIASLQSEIGLLMTRVNAGGELYRTSLIITNKPFGYLPIYGPIITSGLVTYHEFQYGETNFIYNAPDYKTTEPYGSNDLTAVAWVRVTNTIVGSQTIVGKSPEVSGHEYWGMSLYYGRLAVAVQGAFGAPTGFNDTNYIYDNKWHNIGMVISNQVIYAYLDGNNVGKIGPYPPPINIGGPLVMGQWGTTNVLYPWLIDKGDIGSVTIYSRALSDAEMKLLASPKRP